MPQRRIVSQVAVMVLVARCSRVRFSKAQKTKRQEFAMRGLDFGKQKRDGSGLRESFRMF